MNEDEPSRAAEDLRQEGWEESLDALVCGGPRGYAKYRQTLNQTEVRPVPHPIPGHASPFN